MLLSIALMTEHKNKGSKPGSGGCDWGPTVLNPSLARENPALEALTENCTGKMQLRSIIHPGAQWSLQFSCANLKSHSFDVRGPSSSEQQ